MTSKKNRLKILNDNQKKIAENRGGFDLSLVHLYTLEATVGGISAVLVIFAGIFIACIYFSGRHSS
eukprot:TRINITY_DN2568_c0_g1_i1.p1 TRINITY_DN2568_c0_g1~~TRINITY_DN2568_c0_g1_i1.p1  ORF type:complete len:66 (-),score=6.71 TRINITY_DN2568_c0_g1_i1:306-503(-)